MITKQEYIEALERMKVSYYNLEGCMSAMNKFKEDINLLTGLVNEHFEEKQETNYEHYKDEIIEYYGQNLAVVKGRPTLCCETNCNNCDFKINQIGCRETAKYWLKKPYKKLTYKLTQCEYDMLDTIFEKEARFSKVYLIDELKKKGYFKNIKCDSNVRVKNILANCEVTKQ